MNKSYKENKNPHSPVELAIIVLVFAVFFGTLLYVLINQFFSEH